MLFRSKAQQEYYNKVLSNATEKMSTDNLSTLGVEINSKTKQLSISGKDSPEQLDKIFKTYAKNYMKSHPQEFAVGIDGLIHWTK